MNKLDLIHFIIYKLRNEDKFESYMLWFDTIRDTDVREHENDREFKIFTNLTIIQYLHFIVGHDVYTFLHTLQYQDPELFAFLTFNFNRNDEFGNDEFGNDEFYNLFITEAEPYFKTNTLK
jgi:hypothetical protein